MWAILRVPNRTEYNRVEKTVEDHRSRAREGIKASTRSGLDEGDALRKSLYERLNQRGPLTDEEIQERFQSQRNDGGVASSSGVSSSSGIRSQIDTLAAPPSRANAWHSILAFGVSASEISNFDFSALSTHL
jgi:hypothetical protein